jgi:hypothetical protein
MMPKGTMMDEKDYDRYRSLFGENPERWPMPQRQEARAFLAGQSDDPTSPTLDQSILSAALLPTDEAALARSVLSRINAPRPVSWLERLANGMMPKPMLTAFSVLMVSVSLASYNLPIGASGAADLQMVGILLGDVSGVFTNIDAPITPDFWGIE